MQYPRFIANDDGYNAFAAQLLESQSKVILLKSLARCCAFSIHKISTLDPYGSGISDDELSR